jgi:hypothetical protein
MHINGTHTATLPSLMPGAPEVPATGKHFSLPEEPSRATVKDGKITSFAAGQVPDGGVILYRFIGDTRRRTRRIVASCAGDDPLFTPDPGKPWITS